MYYSSVDFSGRFQLDGKSRKRFNIIVSTKYVSLKVIPPLPPGRANGLCLGFLHHVE